MPAMDLACDHFSIYINLCVLLSLLVRLVLDFDYNQIHTYIFISEEFLNQARAGRRPARAWFIEITLMRTSVCVCVCVCLCVRPPGY